MLQYQILQHSFKEDLHYLEDRGVLSGVVIGGGMAAVNPLAPAIFLLLARKAGRMLTDPVALRLMNDALGVDEQIKNFKRSKNKRQKIWIRCL